MDFAITNSGGLRANLTCPTTDIPTDFCPPFTPPPYPITRGQVGRCFLRQHGRQGADQRGGVKDDVGERRLQDAVRRWAVPASRRPIFTYDIGPRPEPGHSAVRQAADGGCTGTPVDLTAASYWIAENDFMATGGDGNPNFYTAGPPRTSWTRCWPATSPANSAGQPGHRRAGSPCTTSGATHVPDVPALRARPAMACLSMSG